MTYHNMIYLSIFIIYTQYDMIQTIKNAIGIIGIIMFNICFKIKYLIYLNLLWFSNTSQLSKKMEH